MIKKLEPIVAENLIPSFNQGATKKPLKELVHRSTLSPTIALAFKPMFDAALATSQDQLIKVQGSPRNFRVRASEALRYCILYLDKPHVDSMNREHQTGEYASLRGKIRFKFEDETQTQLRLHFIANVTPLAFTPAVSTEWRPKFLDFIASPQLNTPLELKGLSLQPDEAAFAEEKILELQGLIETTCKVSYVVDHEKIVVLIQKKD